jgi:CDP-diacylglycerol--serine O-phosphatidyltransferase
MNNLGGFIKKRRSPAPGKRQRLKYIAVLPSLITLMNGLFGFMAVGYASRGFGMEGLIFNRPGLTFFALAGYMVFFAMVADMLDGRVARWSNTTSSFGGQLDSLCDAISFGVAPAFLMVKVVEVRLRLLHAENPVLAGFIGKTVFFAAAVYVCCAVVRLARFNVENQDDESAHMSFSGLPSPAAAGTIVSLVIFQQDLLPKIADRTEAIFRISETVIVWGLPVVAFLAGLLMVSRVRYPHVLNQYLRGKKAFSTFIWVLFGGLLMIWNIQLAMVVSFCGFAAWGALRWWWLKGTGRLKPAHAVSAGNRPAPAGEDAADSPEP